MRKLGLVFVSLLLLTSFAVGCAQPAPEQKPPSEEGVAPKTETPPDEGETAFAITSSAFVDGAEMPVKYTDDGQNVSPPLAWSQGPVGTASFALIMDDLDAGKFTHWVIYNLPPDARGLPEAVPRDEKLDRKALQGKNGGRAIGYFGPSPPKGSPHRYCFTLYALDTSLDLAAGAFKEQVLQAMEGHILAQSQLIGVYQR
jgi:hypothetical protein